MRRKKMTVQAQNALLKTIEEPPSYAVIILITTNQEAFLPTILSRCVQMKLKPLKDFTIKELSDPESPYRGEGCGYLRCIREGKSRKSDPSGFVG